jgi:hypothetical protein
VVEAFDRIAEPRGGVAGPQVVEAVAIGVRTAGLDTKALRDIAEVGVPTILVVAALRAAVDVLTRFIDACLGFIAARTLLTLCRFGGDTVAVYTVAVDALIEAIGGGAALGRTTKALGWITNRIGGALKVVGATHPTTRAAITDFEGRAVAAALAGLLQLLTAPKGEKPECGENNELWDCRSGHVSQAP